jgi:hypothetical protein
MAGAARRGRGFRVGRFVGKAALYFLIGSILWVLIYRFVPPPVTATMLGDLVSGRGITKDWMSLSDMDPDMARAAIAGEDGKFCSHNGFDSEAIRQSAATPAAGASGADRPSASKPQRTRSFGKVAAISAKGWRRGSRCSSRPFGASSGSWKSI